MEIVGTNQDEKDKKSKKLMLWITIAIIMLFITSIILFITIYYLNGQLFKFYINDNKISTFDKNLFIYDGDKVYVSLDDIASLIGCKIENSSYDDRYVEDKTKRYLQSENEIVNIEKGSTTIYKTLVGQEDYAYYEISEPIKENNGKLYINAKDLQQACNLSFSYDPEKNTIKINTLPYYVKYFMSNNQYASVSTNFNNQKAILYGFLITQNTPNTDQNNNPSLYGISDLKGQKIVGEKYTGIEFIVKSEDGKFGIIASNGDTKVEPRYDSIKLIDKDLKLYLVTEGVKQGIVVEKEEYKEGKTLLYPEYEKIGIDLTLFPKNELKNPYVLFNNAIPVKQNGKWGLCDINGNIILPIEYAGIGCSNVPSGANNVVIHPLLKVIVVAKNYEIESQKGRKETITLYGIYNYLGKEVVPAGLQNVYSTITNGRTEYKMKDYNTKEEYNLIEWIAKNKNINELNEEETTKQMEIENTNPNTEVNEIKTNTVINEIKTNTVANEIKTNTVANEIKTNTTN